MVSFPAIRFPAIARPRVSSLLEQALRPHPRLVLVEAPRGFGKTTAVFHWVQNRQDGPRPRWVSLWGTGGEDSVWERISQLVGADGTREGFVRAARSLPEGTIVVVDDYEYATSFEMDQALVEVLEQVPSLQLVVLTRRSTLLASPLATSRVGTSMLQANELLFTEGESEELARRLGASPLVEGHNLDAELLGWPLGTQAMLFSLRNERSWEQSEVALAGRLYEGAGDRLSRQVLTAVAKFPGVSVGHLSGALDIPERRIWSTLQDLAESGAVQGVSRSERRSGQVAPAVRGPLAERVAQTWDQQRLRALIASVAVSQMGEDPVSALELLLEAGRLEQAEELASQHLTQLLDASYRSLPALRAVPPESLCDYPMLLMVRVIVERADTSQPIAVVEELAAQLRQASIRLLAEESGSQRSVQSMLLAAERAVGNWDSAAALARDLLSRLTDMDPEETGVPPRRVEINYSVISLTGCLTGDFELAGQASTRGLDAARRSGDHWEEAHALGLLALSSALAGDMAQASEHLDSMDRLCGEEHIVFREYSWVDGEIARVLLAVEAGDLGAATDALAPILAEADRMEQWPLVLFAQATMTAVLQSRLEGAEILEQAWLEKPEYRVVSPYWASRLLAWAANTAIFNGRYEKARELVQSAASEKKDALLAVPSLRLLLLDGDCQEALKGSAEALENAPAGPARQQLLLLGAVAAQKTCDVQLAKEHWLQLETGLGSVSSSALLSLVPYEWLLENLPLVPEAGAVLERVRALSERDRMRHFQKLSAAELNVLRALRDGGTVAETAKALYLSANTVKFHLRSLYRKLGVSGRDEALFVARRIGLLNGS